MKRALVIAAVGVLASGAMAGAQTTNPGCPAGSITQTEAQDACQMAVDLFDYMNPQLGTIIAGGNATLGQGGTLGGLGHFAVEARANALFGSVPTDLPTPNTTGAVRHDITTKNQILPLPSVDAAIGIFKGLPLGLTNVGGVDLLLSANYLPDVSTSNVDVKTTNGALAIGYGARIGILQESLLVPGISVSILQRNLPKVDLTGHAPAGEDLNVNNLTVKTTAWRVTASKNFLVFGLAAGAGQDKYKSSADVHVSGALATSSPFTVEQQMTRTNYFADVYMNMLLAKLVAEVGMVQGGTATTYSNFDKPADASRTYASVGLRLGF